MVTSHDHKSCSHVSVTCHGHKSWSQVIFTILVTGIDTCTGTGVGLGTRIGTGKDTGIGIGTGPVIVADTVISTTISNQ